MPEYGKLLSLPTTRTVIVAQIELHNPSSGLETLRGTIDNVGLSRTDARALQATAQGIQSMRESAATVAYESRESRRALQSVGYSVDSAVRLLGELEFGLGLALEQQRHILERQAVALERIEDALRHPAKVRAAERVTDADKLIRLGRFERALQLAQDAINDDPLNHIAYSTAGWALHGMSRPAEADPMFGEAALVSSGDDHSRATRQQARLRQSVSGAPAALSLVLNASRDHLSREELLALDYDTAAYHAACGELAEADRLLRPTCQADSRYCLLVLTDPLLADCSTLREIATARLASLAHEVDAAVDALGKLRSENESKLREWERSSSAELLATALGEVRHALSASHVDRGDRRLEDVLAEASAKFDALVETLNRINIDQRKDILVQKDTFRVELRRLYDEQTRVGMSSSFGRGKKLRGLDQQIKTLKARLDDLDHH